MQEIFEEIRGRCSPAAWSRGVELTRSDSVQGVRADPEETVVRVSTRGGLISFDVTIFPEERAWECTCGNRVCEHAAAAAIALRRAKQEGKELPAPRVATAKLAYRFSRVGGAMALERQILEEDKATPLETTLAALVSGRVSGPRVIATREDLSVELALGTHRRGPVSPGLWSKLLPILKRCPDVVLDGAPLEISTEPVVPIARVEDQGEGFRLSVREDPGVTEVFNNGVALCEGRLRPVGQTRLTGRELHELPAGKYYPLELASELVTEVLPSLRERVPIEILTSRLPETSTERPRIVLEVHADDSLLTVLPTLVYGDPVTARVDGGRLVPLQGPIPLRDQKAEQRLLADLSARLGLTPGVRAELSGEEAVRFTTRLRNFRGELRGKGAEAFRLEPPLEPKVTIDGESFHVSFGRADPAVVLRAWREGGKMAPLLGGGWAPLPIGWLGRYGHRIADLLAAKDAAGRVSRSVLPDLVALCEEMDIPVPAAMAELGRLASEFVTIPEAQLPADCTAELRPYQRTGVSWLVFLRGAGLGAMLADDMGLGKTLQALCALEGRALVVAPTSVLHNWVDEVRRFRPALTHGVFHGPRRTLDPAADLTLTTYAILRSDEDLLASVHWDVVVLDEAQNVKNPDSQVARAAHRLQARFRLTLTGTPVENRLEELWSQFHFLNPGLLGNRRDFEERYARPIADGDPGAAERLRRRIRPFVLRRLKREVAPELPPRSDSVLYCELQADERDVYDAVHAAMRPAVLAKLREGGSGSVIAALEALLRMRQAACHAALVPGQTAATSSKVTRLLEALETVVAEGHKALVFSQWTSLLDLVEPHLRSASIDFTRLDGTTRDRGAVVATFQDDAGPPVLLASLKAGGTGLNLTAADHVFLMDPWWNPAVEEQAADRAHRIGQTRRVMVYRLVAEDTIEEKILALQETKRDLADAALGGADRASSLTREDLLFLLE